MKTTHPLPWRRPVAFVVTLLAASLFLCAPTHAGSTKWEYTAVSAHLNNRNLEALLNSYAAQGWELVQITNSGVAIFKRVKR